METAAAFGDATRNVAAPDGCPDGSVDFGHEDLIAFVNDVEIALETGVGSGELSRAVDELLDRIGRELAAEERIMCCTGYPDRAVHRAEHQQLALDLAGAVADGLCGSHESLQPLLSCVRAWLKEHVRTLDVGLARHAAPYDR